MNRARAAISEHLTKPINFERLEEIIQKLLNNNAKRVVARLPMQNHRTGPHRCESKQLEVGVMP